MQLLYLNVISFRLKISYNVLQLTGNYKLCKNFCNFTKFYFCCVNSKLSLNTFIIKQWFLSTLGIHKLKIACNKFVIVCGHYIRYCLLYFCLYFANSIAELMNETSIVSSSVLSPHPTLCLANFYTNQQNFKLQTLIFLIENYICQFATLKAAVDNTFWCKSLSCKTSFGHPVLSLLYSIPRKPRYCIVLAYFPRCPMKNNKWISHQQWGFSEN